MNQTCYTRDELRAFSLGKLNESQAISIEQHIDQHEVEVMEAAEESERDYLEGLAQAVERGAVERGKGH